MSKPSDVLMEGAVAKQKPAEVERQEKEPASISVHFDRALLGKLAEEAMAKSAKGGVDQSLKNMLECLQKLPETLELKSGTTLVIGENGSGKSTLARAINFAMQIKDLMSQEKTGFSEDTYSRDEAERVIFTGGTRYEKLLLSKAGFAPKLARAIDVGSLDAFINGQSGTANLKYEDVIGIKGEKMDLAAIGMSARDDSEGIGPSGSSRQTIDSVMSEYKEWPTEHPGENFVAVLDEPEAGMSPFRQRKLLPELTGMLPEGSVALVPTNSTVLYESDLPRIDLRYPERGIFKPSDYPEYFEE